MTLEDRIRAKQEQQKPQKPVVHTVQASNYEYDCGICGVPHTGPCPKQPADVEDLPSGNVPEGN